MSAVRNAVLERLQKASLVVGFAFVLLLAIGFVIDRGQFFRSYLLGYLFWVEVRSAASGWRCSAS